MPSPIDPVFNRWSAYYWWSVIDLIALELIEWNMGFMNCYPTWSQVKWKSNILQSNVIHFQVPIMSHFFHIFCSFNVEVTLGPALSHT